MRTHGWAWAVWLWFALGALACDEDEGNPTDVYVSFKSDLAIGSELSAVRVRIFRSTDSPATATPVSEHTVSAADLSKRLPLVVEKRDAADFLLAAQALGPGGPGDPLVERQVKVRFQEGQSTSLQVFLGRVCQRKACTAVGGETCFGEAHGATCEGSCGIIDGPDVLPAWSSARSDWQPLLCSASQQGSTVDAGLVPFDAGALTDGEAGVFSVDGGALPDAGPACVPSTPSAPCNAVSQCGCAPDKSCGISALAGTTLQLGCITPGSLAKGAACAAETCLPGNTCVGALCRPFCAQDNDCGAGGHCVTAVTSDSAEQPIPGLSACFAGCGVDSDCDTGCCRTLSSASQAGKLCLAPIACCAQAGSSCTTNDDCCGFEQNLAVCVTEAGGAICRATCNLNTDCASNCCAGLMGGGNACFQANQCQTSCAAANEPCQTNADCCGGATDTAVCVDQGAGPICADRCANNPQCQSGCCAPLQVGGNVCAPSTFCP